MKLNFSKVILKNIDGKVLSDSIDLPHKILANAIYKKSNDLDLVDVAININKGEEVELTQIQVEEIKRIIESPEVNFFAFVKKAFFDFIKNAK